MTVWRFSELCCIERLHTMSVSTVVFFSVSPAPSGFRVLLISGDATGSRLTRALHLISCRGCWRRAPLHVLCVRVCAWAECCLALDLSFFFFLNRNRFHHVARVDKLHDVRSHRNIRSLHLYPRWSVKNDSCPYNSSASLLCIVMYSFPRAGLRRSFLFLAWSTFDVQQGAAAVYYFSFKDPSRWNKMWTQWERRGEKRKKAASFCRRLTCRQIYIFIWG